MRFCFALPAVLTLALGGCAEPETVEKDVLGQAEADVTSSLFGITLSSRVALNSTERTLATYSYDDRRIFVIDWAPYPDLTPSLKAFDPLKGLQAGSSTLLPGAWYWAMSGGGPNNPGGATVLVSLSGQFFLLSLDGSANWTGTTHLNPALVQPGDEDFRITDVDVTNGAIYLAVAAKPNAASPFEARVVRLTSTTVETHVLPPDPNLDDKGFRLAFDHYLPFPELAVALIGNTYYAVCHAGSSLYACDTGTLPTPPDGDDDDWLDLSVWGTKVLAQWAGQQSHQVHLDGLFSTSYEVYPPATEWSVIQSMSLRHNVGIATSYPGGLFLVGRHSSFPAAPADHGFHVPLYP